MQYHKEENCISITFWFTAPEAANTSKSLQALKVATYLSLSVSWLERRECSYFQRFLYKISRTIRPTTFHFFLSTTFSINVVYRMGVYFYGRQEVWCYAGPTSGNFKVTANSGIMGALPESRGGSDLKFTGYLGLGTTTIMMMWLKIRDWAQGLGGGFKLK
jgi:hypothetical protein